MDLGAPIAYMVLEPGTDVYSSDGQVVGTVTHVLDVPAKDVFDGIVLKTPTGHRFADADDIAEIHEQGVLLKLDADAAARLPEPDANPAALDSGADMESPLAAKLRRAWDRISGNY
jgi:hypothetical protein